MTTDPFKILHITKDIAENAQSVSIDRSSIPKIIPRILDQVAIQEVNIDNGFGKVDNFVDGVQLIFLQCAVNFCFWPDKDRPKWEVEYPRGNVVPGGWYALKACFERALAEKVPILDADYLTSLTTEDARHIFRSSNGEEIPLLRERTDNLREAGKVLLDKFNGHFINVLESSDYDAVELTRFIFENFSSFRDMAIHDGREVPFHKRPQICTHNISYLLINRQGKPLDNIHHLTAFSDYKLPQMLRLYGVLEYAPELAQKIDNYIEIPAGTREEIEIRAATIHAIEFIRQRAKNLTAATIDNALWDMSQDAQEEAKPYHRTRTIYY